MFVTLSVVVAALVFVWLCWITHGISFAVFAVILLFFILWGLIHSLMYDQDSS